MSHNQFVLVYTLILLAVGFAIGVTATIASA